MSHSGIQYFNYLVIFYFIILTEGLYEETAVRENFDSDNYWKNPVLRARELTCDENLLQIICQTKCGDNYDCIGYKCYCKQKFETKQYLESVWTKLQKLLKQRNYYVEEISSTPIQEVSPDYEDENADRPLLRHHIAHFCPNLDDARKCIRKCMKIGKPAFCGKDHVCYCGHTYNSHDKVKPMKPDDMYAGYRDLYEKYFGPQSEESSHVKEDEGHGKLMLSFQ